MNNPDVAFRLIKINTEQFAVFDDNIPENESEISLKPSFNFSVQISKRLINALFSVTFISNKLPFIKLDCSCLFEIKQKNWANMYSEDNSEVIIPNQVIKHFAVLTVGTARGILHSKTEKSKAGMFILPTINVNDVIKEDLRIPINKNKNSSNQ